MSETILTLRQRLHQVMQEVTFIQKNKVIDGKYTVVTHDAVTAKLRPAMWKAGIISRPGWFETNQNGNRTELKGVYVFENVDNPEDKITVPMVGYGIDGQDKGPGKALSYAVKMVLLKTFMLESGDGEDPDTDQHTEHVPAKTMADPAAVKGIYDIMVAEVAGCQSVKDLEEVFTRDENHDSFDLLKEVDPVSAASLLQGAVRVVAQTAKSASDCNRFFKTLVHDFSWLKKSNEALHTELLGILGAKKKELSK